MSNSKMNNAIGFPKLIDAANAGGAFTLEVQTSISESLGIAFEVIDDLLARATTQATMSLSGAAQKPEKSYKGLSPIEREVNGDYQHDVETMSRQNVYYCVSYLISDMARQERYQEHLWPVLSCDDWEEPAEWFIENDMSFEDSVEYLTDFGHTDAEHYGINLRQRRVKEHAAYDWQEFACAYGVDPHTIEAYEHWIVSDWFADKLEAQGEMVLKDFHGLTIWGRCTTGQAIHLDSVICNIYNELHEGDI